MAESKRGGVGMGMGDKLNGRERKLITLRSLAAKRKVRSSWVFYIVFCFRQNKCKRFQRRGDVSCVLSVLGGS